MPAAAGNVYPARCSVPFWGKNKKINISQDQIILGFDEVIAYILVGQLVRIWIAAMMPEVVRED